MMNTKIKWGVIGVGVFLILFFGIKACEAASTEFEIGLVYNQSDAEGVVVMVSEVFAEKYALSLGLLDDSYVGDRGWEPYLLVQAQRYVNAGPLTVGLGGTLWQHTSESGGFTFTEMLRLNLGGLALSYRHWSNGGGGSKGLGEDALTVGFKF